MTAKNLIAGTVPEGALALHVILLGKTRSGKSSKARLIVEYCLEAGQPVGIIDPKGDWWGIKLAASGRSAGFPVVIFGGEHADVKINEHSGAQVAELVAAGNRPFLIDLGGWMPAKRTRFFVDFASTFFVRSRGRRILAIDEVHNFAPQGRVLDPDSAKALHWANRLASEGGGKGITLISASQRPQKVHKDYVTSHETLIACKVIHKLDRDAVKDWIDGCGDPEQGREVFKTLGNLKRNEAWVWSPEIEFGPALVQFPMFKTYDSFKPQEAGDAAKLKGWASVDLAEVNEKLAAVVAEAAANDPAKLRAELARAKATISELERRPAVVAPPSDVELAAAEKRGFDRGYLEGIATGRQHVVHVVDDIRNSVERYYAEAQRLADKAYDEKTAAAKPPAPVVAAPKRTNPAKARPGIVAGAGDVGDASFSSSQQKILDALAWAESLGQVEAPKEILAFLADASSRSSGFQNNCGALRTAGMIEYPSPGTVSLTDAGRTRANRPPDALTHEAIMAKLEAKLSSSEIKIVRAAAAAFPDDVGKDELAVEVGASTASSGFQNNCGKCRSLGLITYPKPGRVRASERLFPS